MKVKCVVGVCIALVSCVVSASAQAQEMPHLDISTNKTTLIVSHYKIRTWDGGSGDVLVQRAKGVDTVLEVKARRTNFPETNLTVVTADGEVHMFLVNYNAQPTVLRYGLAGGPHLSLEILHMDEAPAYNEATFEQLSDSILLRKASFRRIRSHSFGVSAHLSGIYIHDELLFFRIHLRNATNIPYDIAQLNFYIRDKNQSKRTASQDLTLFPLYFAGDHSRLDGNTRQDFVTALPKFTIPDKKLLYIIIKEKNGGRLLRLHLSNSVLMKAKEI